MQLLQQESNIREAQWKKEKKCLKQTEMSEKTNVDQLAQNEGKEKEKRSKRGAMNVQSITKKKLTILFEYENQSVRESVTSYVYIRLRSETRFQRNKC